MRNPRVAHFARPLLAALAMALAASAAPAVAQTGQFQATLLADLDALEQKYLALAEAVPETEYDWRPSEEVRSVSQVYTHVVGSNYMLAGPLGAARPENLGIENPPQNLEEVTDKAQVVALLRAVFPHLRAVIEGTPDEALSDEVTLFGQAYTVRGVMLLIVTHMHEHLGQSIAYARSVGVTPPWSG